MPLSPTRLFASSTAVLALAFGVAACGSDDDSDTASAPAATTATTPAATAPVDVVGKSTRLVLNPATAAVLKSNKVTVAPVGPATADKVGIVFPVTGGAVVVSSLAGTIDHSGGLKFSAGGKEVVATDFEVNTETKQLVATIGGAQVPLLDLNLTGLKKATGPNGEIVASNIATTLTSEAATALNEAFGVTLFKAGLPIGTVTVTVAAKS
jgi:hypothetical protein